MLISLSLSTISSRLRVWPRWFRASRVRPLASAASPTQTAIRCFCGAGQPPAGGPERRPGRRRCSPRSRHGHHRTRRGRSRCAVGSHRCRPPGARCRRRRLGRSGACGRRPGGRCPTRSGRTASPSPGGARSRSPPPQRRREVAAGLLDGADHLLAQLSGQLVELGVGQDRSWAGSVTRSRTDGVRVKTVPSIDRCPANPDQAGRSAPCLRIGSGEGDTVSGFGSAPASPRRPSSVMVSSAAFSRSSQAA